MEIPSSNTLVPSARQCFTPIGLQVMDFFPGNLGIGNTTPNAPLSFGNDLGDKISMWTLGDGSSYGFGIQGYTLQIHTDVVQAGVAFGYGSSASFVENFRFKGNGAFAVQVKWDKRDRCSHRTERRRTIMDQPRANISILPSNGQQR
jgi:hypothetical protein